jgi:hypothetical protein
VAPADFGASISLLRRSGAMVNDPATLFPAVQQATKAS